MEISRTIVIARSREDVFAYIADARNDPEWCGKVLSVEQAEGEGPGPGARYTVVHRPVPLRPPRTMEYRCLSWDAPSRVEWREDDGTDELLVTYLLEQVGDATRLTQNSVVKLAASRVLHPLMRVGIGHDIAVQLRALKRRLELQSGEPSWV